MLVDNFILDINELGAVWEAGMYEYSCRYSGKGVIKDIEGNVLENYNEGDLKYSGLGSVGIKDGNFYIGSADVEKDILYTDDNIVSVKDLVYINGVIKFTGLFYHVEIYNAEPIYMRYFNLIQEVKKNSKFISGMRQINFSTFVELFIDDTANVRYWDFTSTYNNIAEIMYETPQSGYKGVRINKLSGRTSITYGESGKHPHNYYFNPSSFFGIKDKTLFIVSLDNALGISISEN